MEHIHRVRISLHGARWSVMRLVRWCLLGLVEKEQIAYSFGAEVATMSKAVAMAADIGAFRVVFETDS